MALLKTICPIVTAGVRIAGSDRVRCNAETEDSVTIDPSIHRLMSRAE